MTPLCVDLDNTAIKTDSLKEQVLEFIKSKPHLVFRLFAAFLKGKPRLKKYIVDQIEFSVDHLPLNTEVMTYVEKAARDGRRVVLVTGANQKIADKFKEHYPVFSEAYGSDEQINLIGNNKAAFLIEKFGEGQFDYMGDSSVDFKVWTVANGGTVVSHRPSFVEKVKKTFSHKAMDTIFIEKNSLAQILKLIRIGQWAKNGLLLVPLALAHHLNSFSLVMKSLLAFLAFSFLASTVYTLNDLLDLANDRQHPSKMKRPLAAGTVSIEVGLGTAILLSLLFLLCAVNLPMAFTWCCLAYGILNVLYSFRFKKVIVLDAFILASFYSLRISAGSAAIGVEESHWLIIFSTFFFLSLGFLKRYSDLLFISEATSKSALPGRSYVQGDRSLLMTAGMVSGFVSILVFALYIYGGDSLKYYSKPRLLWGALFCMLYWVTKMWFNGAHGLVQDDPVKFALRDKESLLLGGLTLIFLTLAV